LATSEIGLRRCRRTDGMRLCCAELLPESSACVLADIVKCWMRGTREKEKDDYTALLPPIPDLPRGREKLDSGKLKNRVISRSLAGEERGKSVERIRKRSASRERVC